LFEPPAEFWLNASEMLQSCGRSSGVHDESLNVVVCAFAGSLRVNLHPLLKLCPRRPLCAGTSAPAGVVPPVPLPPPAPPPRPPEPADPPAAPATPDPADPAAPPRIDQNYLADPDDLRVMRAGIRIAREVFRQPAFDPYRGEELDPGADATSDADLDAYVRDKSEADYHSVGTCKMGRDALSVVDERLRVRGLEGLRVVDASVMPRIVSGNTNMATIMIAEKASDLILGRPPLPPCEPGPGSTAAGPTPEEGRR